MIKQFKDSYYLSESGCVFYIKNNKKRIVKPCDNGNGYKYFTIKRNNKRKHYYIHRAMAIAFLKKTADVHHADGNRGNNHINNLIPVDSVKDHRNKYHFALLTRNRLWIKMFYKMFMDGFKLEDIAALFKVDQETISRSIKNYVNYKHNILCRSKLNGLE